MEQYYYSTATGQTYSAYQMQAGFGIDAANSSVEVLNYRGFYPVVPADPDFDVFLYDPIVSYVVSGTEALMTWTPVAKPLAVAQANGSQKLKETANADVNIEACDCGFTTDLLTGVASQAEVDRATRYQEELDSIAAIATSLDSDLTAVETATSVDEINAIGHKPYGLLNTGRGGPGQAGPRDLNLSYFTSIEDLPGFTQADLELYVPGTDTVIPYTDSLPEPFHFDSAGNCFNNNDWRLVIRYAGGGAVLSTITVPQGANVDVPWVYNPVIPSLGGSSSSAF